MNRPVRSPGPQRSRVFDVADNLGCCRGEHLLNHFPGQQPALLISMLIVLVRESMPLATTGSRARRRLALLLGHDADDEIGPDRLTKAALQS